MLIRCCSLDALSMLFPEKIYCPEELRERANKALRPNDDISPNYDPRLLGDFSIKKKPTVRIKLSNLQRQLLVEKAQKALILNGVIRQIVSSRVLAIIILTLHLAFLSSL